MSEIDNEILNNLADAVLAQNSAVGSLVCGIDRVLLQLQAATNQMGKNDDHMHEIRSIFGTIRERLAVTSDNVKDVQTGVAAVRDKSAQFQRQDKDSGRHAAVGALRAFGAMPKLTQIMLVVLILALAASGWLAKLL